MTILRRLWSEARVTHQGKYSRFTDVELLPKPVQLPVPIYMAINPSGGTTMRRPSIASCIVATHADGWQTDATPVDTFRQRFDTIRDHAARQGHA